MYDPRMLMILLLLFLKFEFVRFWLIYTMPPQIIVFTKALVATFCPKQGLLEYGHTNHECLCGLHSHPPTKPARLKPVTRYGQFRINRHNKPLR